MKAIPSGVRDVFIARFICGMLICALDIFFNSIDNHSVIDSFLTISFQVYSLYAILVGTVVFVLNKLKYKKENYIIFKLLPVFIDLFKDITAMSMVAAGYFFLLAVTLNLIWSIALIILGLVFYEFSSCIQDEKIKSESTTHPTQTRRAFLRSRTPKPPRCRAFRGRE